MSEDYIYSGERDVFEVCCLSHLLPDMYLNFEVSVGFLGFWLSLAEKKNKFGSS